MERSCIITGASGFVGQNLVPYLQKDKYRIKLLSRDELSNICKLPLTSYDTIIHLAGKAHDLKSIADPQEYYDVNFELTKNIFNAFLASDASTFIYVSSVKAVADVANGILTEQAIPNPATHYGKSKLLAEQYLQSIELPAGKRYFIIRPCMIHGPGNKGNLNLLYKVVEKGIPYPLAAFTNRRSFLSVENFCFIVKELIENENIVSGVYHVADDNSLSTNEVITIMASVFNKKPRLLKIPCSFMFFIARAGDMLHLPLNTERLKKLTENYMVDNSKIKAAIKKPLPLGIEEGLKVTAASFYKNKR